MTLVTDGTTKRWRVAPHDAAKIATLANQVGVSPVVAQLLVARGIATAGTAQSFLESKLSTLHDPDILAGIPAAAQRIHAAVRNKERIIVYGDYDADGMTATAILVRCLQMLSADVGYYVPNRLEEGYGLNSEALTKLAQRQTKVVVSVDCGIASVREAQHARELGLDLIITDHHAMGSELPDAILVHPRLPGREYLFPGLCGAGVAFKLAWAICQCACDSKKVTERLRNFLLTAVGLAAIGTVADVVPMVDENRVIVRHGLMSLKNRPPLGIAALCKLTGADKKTSLQSEDIGFTLAPRLNAAGRLGQAQLGVELLVTECSDRARSLAEYIHELNNSRDSLERSIYLAANKQASEQFDPVGDPALVLAGRGWHPGVIGIVAGRLAEKYNRPVVMIALDELATKPGSGSARSSNGLDLHRALNVCTDDLVAHGGHAAAAGLRIDEAHVDRFRAHFCEYVASEIAPEDQVAELAIDAESTFAQLNLRSVEQIEQLAPFGAENPRPLLCASSVNLEGEPKRMGKGERHLSLRFSQHNVVLRAVAFGQADWADPIAQVDGTLDIAYRPVINEFRGRRSVELHLADWRPASVV